MLKALSTTGEILDNTIRAPAHRKTAALAHQRRYAVVVIDCGPHLGIRSVVMEELNGRARVLPSTPDIYQLVCPRKANGIGSLLKNWHHTHQEPLGRPTVALPQFDVRALDHSAAIDIHQQAGHHTHEVESLLRGLKSPFDLTVFSPLLTDVPAICSKVVTRCQGLKAVAPVLVAMSYPLLRECASVF